MRFTTLTDSTPCVTYGIAEDCKYSTQNHSIWLKMIQLENLQVKGNKLLQSLHSLIRIKKTQLVFVLLEMKEASITEIQII